MAVVIPTRDREPLLRRALASVRGADQVVVVDDGSTTYPAELASDLCAGGVEYVRLETSRGPGVARNRGVEFVRTDLVLFLDDDDYVLDGGLERIRTVADEHPDQMLYLHNCQFSNGGTTVPESARTRELSFEDWVRLFAGAERAEFKPVARTCVFRHDAFDDTGASGEGLLWARVIRRHGALLSYDPIIYYDVDEGRPRLTSASELLARSGANARIASAWLNEVGPTMRTIDHDAWRRLVIGAAVYAGLAGEHKAFSVPARLDMRDQLLVGLIRRVPRPLLLRTFQLLKARSG